jgi:glycine/D-amino acid oxidase-like deaminating enzyme
VNARPTRRDALDVVVAGAGVVGSSAALALARAG